jgi:hypothetical protein
LLHAFEVASVGAVEQATTMTIFRQIPQVTEIISVLTPKNTPRRLQIPKPVICCLQAQLQLSFDRHIA